MEILYKSFSGGSFAANMEAIEQTLTCPICSDFFTDPILLPCGHNFCQTCIRIVWNMDDLGVPSKGPMFCPECQIFLLSDLKLEINTNLQQKIQQLNTHEETLLSSASAITCDHCIEKPSVAVKNCLNCDASLCSAHTLHHQHKQRLRGHTLIEVTENVLFYKCQKHGEELKLFCEDDKAAVCSLCVVVGEHKSHQVIQLQEACVGFKKAVKDQEFHLLQKKHMAQSAVKDLHQLFSKALCSAEACKIRIADKYSQMKALIDKDQQLMMDIIEMEGLYTIKMLESKREALEHHIKDIDALLSAGKYLLQESDQLKLLQHLKMHKYGARPDLSSVASVEKNLCISQKIETVQQLAENLYDIMFQNTKRLWTNFRAIHLDAESAHPKLEVSSDLLEVRWGKESTQKNKCTEEVFAEYSVLSKEYFSSGCHYWEIAVWDKPYWLIGLSYTQSGKKNATIACNFLNQAFCYIYHGNGKYLVCNGSEETMLPEEKHIQKIGVCVDIDSVGTVSFYDAEKMKLLHFFYVEFLGPVSALFNPCLSLNEQNKQPLILLNLRSQKEVI